MPTPSAPATALRTTTLPFDALQAFPRLFRDYCTRFDVLSGHYAGNWKDTASRVAAADRAAGHTRDRDTLADVLLKQHEAWGIDAATQANIEALRDPDTVAVVTGQQTTVLGGPLYSPLKILTTLHQAEALANDTGRSVVPVFWLEGEDHDWDEMAGTHVLHRNALVPLRYEGYAPPAEGNLGAVGRLPVEAQFEDVIDAVNEALPPSDFKPDVMALVRDAYTTGTPLEVAFARFIRGLFPDSGLVLLNPDDARLKALVAPLYKKELMDPHTTSHLVNEAGAALEDTGYHAQVHARGTNLFLLEEDVRLPIDATDEGFVLRGTDRTFTTTDLLSVLQKHPERFSPNVVLRPLTQDQLLPTAVYVAGPGEISYFAQYQEVYAWANIPMPLLHPRASATLVESKVAKVLEQFDLSVADLDTDLDRLFQQVVVEQMEVNVDAVFGDAQPPIHQSLNTLKEHITSVDRTLGKSAEATRTAIVQELTSLKDRVVRAEKRKQDQLYAQLKKAHVNLFPSGRPQERVVSVLYFLNKYSPALLEQLRHALAPDADAHQVVYL